MGEFLVICGLSGAGRSQAADHLEDMGWFVIDNVPPSLIPKLLPMLLPIALKAGQIGLRHRGLLLAALSSAIVGWGLLRERNAAADEEMPAAEQPAE